jgi:hypothetical protein
MAVSNTKFTGFAFGAALLASLLPNSAANAMPFGAVADLRTETALPLVDVQARVNQRRPARPQARRGRNNNGALAAGALIGAAIIGGAIIANSQQRRREPTYYYGPGYAPGYAPGYYGPGYVQPRQPRPRYYDGPVYQQPPTYYQQPGYVYEPRQRVRQPNNSGLTPIGPGSQIIATPDKETPYTYAPAPQPQYQPQPRRRGIIHIPN